MLKKGLPLTLFLFFQVLCLAAQSSLVWWNPARHAFPVIEGQAWNQELQQPYDRLPGRAEKQVRPAVWNLSRQSAGLFIRFKSNSDQITIRYQIKGNQALPHIPATGVSGVDLYARSPHGDFWWCNGKYAFGDTITYRYTSLQTSEKGQEYRLYLPLYTSVQWLEIGIPEGKTLTPLALRPEKPIVVYGTSIAQGACASRPGMAWTAQLERQMDHPLLNLGFSGNGKLEPELINLISEIDARLYVLDCLPNLISTTDVKPAEVKKRILQSVRTLRQKRPTVPILLVEHAGYTDGFSNPVRAALVTEVNIIMQEAYAELKAEIKGSVYLLTKTALNLSPDAMVDGTHPSDLGMQQYAQAYERIIRSILNEPVGTLSTTIPKSQSRDFYDFETRHRDVLNRLKTYPPRIVFLGNSITHFWGGEPKTKIVQGASSWNRLMEPRKVQNLGFGWDRIENVLWRVYHGQLDGYQAKQVLVMIGTNNLEGNTDEEIADGLVFLMKAIQSRQPQAELVWIGILPRRGQEERVHRLNQHFAQRSGELNIRFLQPGTNLLQQDGKINEAWFTDGLHPNEQGYERLAEKLEPFLVGR
ncbi:acetylhydrolase [Siphonobacter sp. BAB-5385]|uniref:SGNH/GDSL hydrolase family protein n=1 Tax=Siphonobacter sp. BAB-5385 TaxID=1864822 RepID=UPI000B9E83CE|nr:SGNH/GDSL hydrolase family protein [Siphonobacter sp. BAB-5385]OZI07858.1 acetylhydrolase [Siphonobacter sp. BAB-5385]